MAVNPVRRADATAHLLTLGGWLFVLLGERVFAASEGLAKLFTWLGAMALVAALAGRVWSLQHASADRRGSARLFLVLSLGSVLALAVYGATTGPGRELLHLGKAKAEGADAVGSIGTVTWLVLLVASVVPTVFGELARWSMQRAERFESRRVFAAVAAGLTLGLAAVYGALFTYAADQADKSADFSYFRVSRPGEATKRMVESLAEPLEVLVFLPPTTEVRAEVMKYLEDLRAGREDRLTVSLHDFLGEPELAKEHKLTKDGVLVLARGKASQKLDIGVEEDKARRVLKKLDGEFQKVLLKAMRDRRTAYLTVGHGEINEDGDKTRARTAEGVRQLLEADNHQVKTLGLADGLGTAIPKDASAVLVLGPAERFTDAEVETLRSYAEGGGKLLLALDPDSKADLAPLASIVGLDWKPTVVVNEVAQARMQGTPADRKILVAATFSSHASVSTLSKAGHSAPLLFAGAASLERAADSDKALLVDFAIRTGGSTFLDANDDLVFDAATEKKAVHHLAAAVSRKLGEAKDAPEMRAFVLSDADAVTDFWFRQDRNNQLMFVEAMRWLGGEESFSGEIQSEEDVAIVHTKVEDQAYFYGTIVGAPSIVLGIGLALSMRRRRSTRGTSERSDASRGGAA